MYIGHRHYPGREPTIAEIETRMEIVRDLKRMYIAKGDPKGRVPDCLVALMLGDHLASVRALAESFTPPTKIRRVGMAVEADPSLLSLPVREIARRVGCHPRIVWRYFQRHPEHQRRRS